MIEARRSRPFEILFRTYAAWTIKRHFHALYVLGEPPRTLAPLVVAAQHVGWWDPIVLGYLALAAFPGKHFVMMDEASLQRAGFFRWIGGFSVDRSSSVSSIDGIRYAITRLKAPGSRVWVFPQGEFAPADRRPLGCNPGAAWLAARARVPVVAVTLRYEHRRFQYPDVFVRFGAPVLLDAAAAKNPGVLEELLASQADGLREAVWSTREDEFRVALEGRRSVSATYGSE